MFVESFCIWENLTKYGQEGGKLQYCLRSNADQLAVIHQVPIQQRRPFSRTVSSTRSVFRFQ